MAICKECPFNSTNAKLTEGYTSSRLDEHCTNCGCNLYLKTRALSAACPDKRWFKETTIKEEKEIKKYLKENENNNNL